MLTDEDLDHEGLKKFFNNVNFINLIKSFFKYENLDFSLNDNYRVLRVLNGPGSNTDNQNLHFDGYYLTLMLPIHIPNENDNFNGDFMIIPNIRPVFKSKILNLVLKVIAQNKLSKIFFKTKIFKIIFKPIKIIPKPGSLIIFRGFSSLHGSGILKSNRKRATLLFHLKKMK